MVYQEPLSSLSREVSDLQAPCVKILVMVTFATEFCYFFFVIFGVLNSKFNTGLIAITIYGTVEHRLVHRMSHKLRSLSWQRRMMESREQQYNNNTLGCG